MARVRELGVHGKTVRAPSQLKSERTRVFTSLERLLAFLEELPADAELEVARKKDSLEGRGGARLSCPSASLRASLSVSLPGPPRARAGRTGPSKEDGARRVAPSEPLRYNKGAQGVPRALSAWSRLAATLGLRRTGRPRPLSICNPPKKPARGRAGFTIGCLGAKSSPYSPSSWPPGSMLLKRQRGTNR